MAPDIAVVLVLAVTLPLLGWLTSEFHERRWVRIALGTIAVMSSLSAAVLVGMAERFNAHAWYGAAARELVDAAVAELEAGNVDGVVASLKAMQREYRPTYENRARFDVLCDQAVARMKARDAASR